MSNKKKLLKGPTVHIRGTKREGEVDIIVGDERKKPRTNKRLGALSAIYNGPRKVERFGTGIRVTERKGPKRAKLAHSPSIVLRLPVRTLTCAHDRDAVCQHCVQGVTTRAMYSAAIAANPTVRILRLDAWRVSGDSQMQRAAGMQEIKTTMAELQRQIMLHEKFVCDGCVHCKEDSHAN